MFTTTHTLGGAAAADATPSGVTLTRRSFLAGAAALAGALALAPAARALAADGEAGSSAADAGASTSSASSDVPPDPDADTSAGKQGGTFMFSMIEPAGIEPFSAEEVQGMEICTNLFDTLTYYDQFAKRIKCLACESYESNADATQFTFHLRKEAKFHNGQPVTSKDYKYAWERLCRADFKPSPSTLGYVLAPVKGAEEMMAGTGTELDVECPDDYTFVVNLKSAFADLPYITTNYCTSAVPAGCTDTEEDFQKFALAPVGNGPFKMDGEWVEGQYIMLTRNDDYWGDKPLIDGVTFQLFKDNQAAWTEFSAGTMDWAEMPTGQYQASLSQWGAGGLDGNLANPGQQVFNGEETTVYYLPCNLKDEVMGNKDVRIGISYALNRQAICDTALEGSRSPASDMIPAVVNGHRDNAWPHCDPQGDKAKAGEYLDKAGYPAGADGKRGISLVLSTNTSGGNEAIFAMIQADLAQVGIDAQIQTQEWAAYLDAVQNHDFQIGRMGATMPSPLAYYTLHENFYTDVSNNYGQYSNPDFDAAVDKAVAIVDEAERTKAYQDADDIVANDFPCIPMFYYTHGYVAGSRVHNLLSDSGGIARLNRCWLG